MSDQIKFPRVFADSQPYDAQETANFVHAFAVKMARGLSFGCANGMPGRPPCRSTDELEAMLRATADTTAAREGV